MELLWKQSITIDVPAKMRIDINTKILLSQRVLVQSIQSLMHTSETRNQLTNPSQTSRLIFMNSAITSNQYHRIAYAIKDHCNHGFTTLKYTKKFENIENIENLQNIQNWTIMKYLHSYNQLQGIQRLLTRYPKSKISKIYNKIFNILQDVLKPFCLCLASLSSLPPKPQLPLYVGFIC